MVGLGVEFQALAMSADGSVIVGVGYGPSGSGGEAYRWTQARGWVALGDLAGGNFGSSARGVSADGSVVVGGGSSAQSGQYNEAFRWTAASGMVGLGSLPGSTFASWANAVSADGTVVVGSSAVFFSEGDSVRWTSATGMVRLDAGGIVGSANAISADGTTIVGDARDSTGPTQAYRWTSATGMVGLGFLPTSPPYPPSSWATGVSADGSIIVGSSYTGPGSEVFVWDQVRGMRSLRTVLVDDYHLNMAGWRLRGARISADGKTIVGSAQGPGGVYQAYIARLPAVCYANCDGSTTAPILNVSDFLCFISRFMAGDSWANCDGSTTPPTLNIYDFICFQQKFALGCTW
jgi:probable HAF family extracellular repeat protein